MTVDDGLDLAVAFGRNDGGHASGVEVCEDGVGVVTLVAHEHLRLGAGLGHQRGVTPDVGSLAAGQDDGDGQAQAVGSQMDLGREATARAAKTFAMSTRFFLAPAAC
jgi:hypothetical protein